MILPLRTELYEHVFERLHIVLHFWQNKANVSAQGVYFAKAYNPSSKRVALYDVIQDLNLPHIENLKEKFFKYW